MRKQSIFLAFLVVLIVSCQIGHCINTTRISLFTDCIWGQSECPRNEVHPCLAGACAMLNVGISDLPEADAFQGVDAFDKWPEGLTIDVGIYENDEWKKVPDIAESLRFQKWTRLAGPKLNQPGDRDLSWMFLFTIPEDLVGKTVWFQAKYMLTDKRVIASELNTDGLNPKKILVSVVAPCSDTDRDKIAGTYVTAERSAQHYDRAMAIADSLIPLGWRDLAGLGAAKGAASAVGDAEKELMYLDLNYEANGRIAEFHKDMTDDAARDIYLTVRQEILNKISK